MPTNVRPLFGKRIPPKANPPARASTTTTKKQSSFDWKTIAITAAIASVAGAAAVGIFSLITKRLASKLTREKPEQQPNAALALPPAPPVAPATAAAAPVQTFATLNNPYLLAALNPPATIGSSEQPEWFRQWERENSRQMRKLQRAFTGEED